MSVRIELSRIRHVKGKGETGKDLGGPYKVHFLIACHLLLIYLDMPKCLKATSMKVYCCDINIMWYYQTFCNNQWISRLNHQHITFPTKLKIRHTRIHFGLTVVIHSTALI